MSSICRLSARNSRWWMDRTEREAPQAHQLHRKIERPPEVKDTGSDLAEQQTQVSAPLTPINSSFLQHASGGKSSVIHRSLLKMQRMYGNSYVQRAVAQAQQEDAQPGAEAEVETAIQRTRGG